MNSKQLGIKIKDLRKKVGLTQKELAEGICTQAQISNIENGELNISSILLYNLCEKMGVGMDYFFDITSSKKDERILSVKDLIRKLIRKRDYQSIFYIISKEKDNYHKLNIYDKQFFLWHEGICDFYVNNEADLAIKKLENAIDLTNPNKKNYTQREIEILNSIAIILSEEVKHEEALEKFEQALHHFGKLATGNNENIKIRILYGLSKCLTDIEDYKKSLHYSKLGRQICLESQTLYLLGEFLYQIGRNYILMSNIKTGENYMNQAISLFKIQDNYKFADLIISELEELEILY